MEQLSNDERKLLRRLGLSKGGVDLYEHLLARGPLTARQAADLTKELPSAEYRLFRQLEALGLVRRTQKRPAVFAPTAKAIGLRAAYMTFTAALENLVERAGAGDTVSGYQMEIIVGRQALYDRYMELAERAEREICIYAIGIAYSESLERSQRSAIKRGVRIRHALQQIRPSNYHVAHKWRKLGVDVRYSPSERGFHLMLFDSRTLLLSFSNPKDTDDRLSIITNNPAAVRLFAADFENIWSEAQRVKV